MAIERTLSQRRVYDGRILNVRVDEAILPNGKTVTREVIEHHGACGIVAFDEEGKLLMVRQYRNALDRFTLEIPAGALDFAGEPKIDCAYRELEEETGFRTEKLEYLISVHTTVAFCDEAIDIFVARNLIPSKQHLDEEESLEVEAWDVKELHELIYKGEITDGKTIAAIMAYSQKYLCGKE